VQNGSFEEYSYCPYQLGGIKYVKAWNKSNKSVEYFNECNKKNYTENRNAKPYFSTNVAGFQLPFDGNAYVGFIPYGEYLQTKLLTSFYKDSVYYISFYVNRANKTSSAISNIGAYLTTKKIQRDNIIENSKLKPAIVNKSGFIKDTISWVKISGFFKSDSIYNYLTISRFTHPFYKEGYLKLNDNKYTKVFYDAYYYVDNVYITKLDNVNSAEVRNQKLQLNLNFIEFKNNEYIIENINDKKYLSLIKLLKKYSFTDISISGYTNSIGSEKLNNKLAKNRALDVKKLLLDNGIDANRIIYAGTGIENITKRVVFIELQ